jgi:hypothetical protein
VLQTRSTSFVLSAVHYQVQVAFLFSLTCNNKRCLYCRLDAVAFKPSRNQRKLVNRYVLILRVVHHSFNQNPSWNRYVVNGKKDEAMDIEQGKERCVKSYHPHTMLENNP